jgi:hypothetical protein
VGDELRATTEEEANRLMRGWQSELAHASDALRGVLFDLDRAREKGPPEWLIPPSTAERQTLRAERDAYRTALLAANQRRRTVERIREDMERRWTPPPSREEKASAAPGVCRGCGEDVKPGKTRCGALECGGPSVAPVLRSDWTCEAGTKACPGTQGSLAKDWICIACGRKAHAPVTWREKGLVRKAPTYEPAPSPGEDAATTPSTPAKETT